MLSHVSLPFASPHRLSARTLTGLNEHASLATRLSRPVLECSKFEESVITQYPLLLKKAGFELDRSPGNLVSVNDRGKRTGWKRAAKRNRLGKAISCSADSKVPLCRGASSNYSPENWVVVAYHVAPWTEKLNTLDRLVGTGCIVNDHLTIGSDGRTNAHLRKTWITRGHEKGQYDQT